MKKSEDYSNHIYRTKKNWLKVVRKRWVSMRSSFRYNNNNVMLGSAFYPDEVYDWLKKFNEMDKKMKEYYKNA